MSETDLLVTVHSRAQGIFGIIDMKTLKMLQADQFLEGAKEILITLSPGDIESGRKDMAGIQADPQLLGIAT